MKSYLFGILRAVILGALLLLFTIAVAVSLGYPVFDILLSFLAFFIKYPIFLQLILVLMLLAGANLFFESSMSDFERTFSKKR